MVTTVKYHSTMPVNEWIVTIITRMPASADRTARAANFRRAALIGDVGL